VIRDLRAPRRKKAFAQKLIEIWNSGDDYTAQMLYEQALRESVPSCCLIREKHTDSDEAYSPAAIREGYYTVEKETGKEIFVRHGLSREFAVNGCFVHESFWEHGKMTKNIMTLKGYSAN